MSHFSNKTGHIYFTLCLLIAAFEIYSSPHTVLLKTGTTIKGTVIGQNESGLTVKKSDGSTATVSKKKVLKVVYRDVTREEEKNIRKEEERKGKQEQISHPLLPAPHLEPQTIVRTEADSHPITEPRNQKDILTNKGTLPKTSVAEGIDHQISGMVWRNAVLPGWGFYYAEKKNHSYIYAGLFWAPLLFAIHTKSQVDSARSAYNNANNFYQWGRPELTYLARGENIQGQTQLPQAFVQETILREFSNLAKKDLQAKIVTYNTSVQLAVFVYFVQLGHSFLLGKQWEKSFSETHQSESNSGWQIHSRWEWVGIDWETRSSMGYSWRF